MNIFTYNNYCTFNIGVITSIFILTKGTIVIHTNEQT